MRERMQSNKATKIGKPLIERYAAFLINEKPQSIENEIHRILNYKYSYFKDNKLSKETCLNIYTLDYSVQNDFRILLPKLQIEYNNELLNSFVYFEKKMQNIYSDYNKKDSLIFETKEYFETLSYNKFNK